MKRKYTVTSLDTEKLIDKVKCPYMRNTFCKPVKEMTVIKLINIYEIPTTNFIVRNWMISSYD
jgi:hypothetical protein